MANTIEIVIRADNKASGQIKALVGDIGKQFESLGKKMAVGGLALGAAIAPAALGFKSAINSARQFDETMTDAQAILGVTRDEMQALNAQVLDLGAKSVAGPQAAAAAFVEIAGGVSDASLHMSILEAAMKTAEAGAADLGATTSGLVAIMNSYGFSADQTSRVSDIMTRTVGMGVLTMDELAVAMPQVTSIAKTMGVSFEELGSNVAYLTAQGLSANVASTQLRATMTAMMKPTAGMTAAFEELGVATGQELIENTGSLLAALWNIKNTSVYAEQGVGNIFGSVEAMNAVLSMMGGASTEFFEEFQMGLDGATEAARKIQLEGVNAQMALLKNQAEALKIEIGMMLLPVVNRIVGAVIPAVAALRSWARENPQVVKTIGMVVGALAGLAAAMTTGGGAVALLARTLPMLLNPVGLVVGALAGLGVAYKENLLGFGDFVRDIAAGATDLANQVVDRFREGGFAGVGQWALEQIKAGLQTVIDWGASVVSPIITDISTAFETGGLPAVGELILDKIGEGLTGAADWAAGWIQPIIDTISGKVFPGKKTKVEVTVEPTFDLSKYDDMPLFEGTVEVNTLTWAGHINLATATAEMVPEAATEITAVLNKSLEEQLPGIDLGALLWTPENKKNMETRTTEAMRDTPVVQKMLDGLSSGAADFVGFVNTNLVYPVIEKIQTTDWAAKINAVGDVLAKILHGIASGAIDFGAWVLGDIMTPIANKLNDDELWTSVGSTLGQAGAKVVAGMAVMTAFTYQWAVDNVGKPIAEAILDAVQDPETAASLIASGIQLALKLGEGIMRLPYSIASGFVSGFVGEVGRLLGIDLSNFGHGTITLNEYDIAHLAALTEPGREGIRSQSTPTVGEDMGGPHSGRGPVWIGSGQQPELFWPNEAGTFYPASRFGGGDAVNNWTVNLYGIQDMKQALDELEREARRRNRRLTVGMGGAG